MLSIYSRHLISIVLGIRDSSPARSNWGFHSLHILQLVHGNLYPFYIPEAWKKYPFRAEPLRILHYRGYPPPGHNPQGVFLKSKLIINSLRGRRSKGKGKERVFGAREKREVRARKEGGEREHLQGRYCFRTPATRARKWNTLLSRVLA